MIEGTRASFVVDLSRALRQAGVAVSPDRSLVAADAIGAVGPTRPGDLYWATRLSLVSARAQIEVFDRVFESLCEGEVWPKRRPGDTEAPNAAAAPPQQPPRRPASRSRLAGRTGGQIQPGWASAASDHTKEIDSSQAAALAAASPQERLAQRNFEELTPEELTELRVLMSGLTLSLPRRRSRRTRPARSGPRLDLRATLRPRVLLEGYPTRLAWRQRRWQPRRLVVLCDISGSMEPYARAYLQFLQSAVGVGEAEVFVFATRLTRLTRVLRRAPVLVAMQRAAQAAPDWSGGTRIAASLRRFNRTYGSRGLAREAVIVILSDGWETEDPQGLGREMAVLRRLAHRIIWVNPHKGSPHFAPLAGGMAAALPYCDAFASGHSFSALREVAQAIATGR